MLQFVRAQSRTFALAASLALVPAATEALGAMDEPPVSSWKAGHYGAWSNVASETPPFNLILLTLDTTRQDHLSCYGYAKNTTPHLDQIAREGLLFEHAFTPVPVTLPSHATMLTGLYPFQHGVRHNGSYVLDQGQITLTELLKTHGYDTGAILGSFAVDHRFGLNQGFDEYDDRFPPETAGREVDTEQRPASDVTRLALKWLDARTSKPFFLWAHYFDPHAPYHPPEPFKSQFPKDPYDGEIASMDASIGDLIEGLRARRLLDRTVILIAADHGEGLGEHGELTHSIFTYGATQRVPLIVRLPQAGPFAGKSWRGRRIPQLSSLTDIPATAWNALGFPEEELPKNAGRSLLAVAQTEDPGHSWVYHESLVPELDYGAGQIRGLQTADGWKYILCPRPELYNLGVDPDEKKNLLSEEAERAQSMEKDLRGLLRAEPEVGRQVAMDQETMEKLKSLGYLGGTQSKPAAGATLPDAKDLRGIPMALAKAQILAAEYRSTEALAVVDSVLTRNPKTKMAQRLRADFLVRLGKNDEALKAYDVALAECRGCPDEPNLLQEQATALFSAGRLTEAMTKTKGLIQAHPKVQGLHLLLGRILQAKGNLDEASKCFRDEAGLFPEDASPWVKIGTLEAARKRPADAERAYGKALEINPRDADAMVMLSELFSQTGRQSESEELADKALALAPNHPGAHFRKALALQQQGKKQEAIQHYQAALKEQNDNPLILFNLGSLYMGLGNGAEAVKCFEQSIATGRAPQGAYANLGFMQAQAGRYAEAIKQWELAVQRDPNSRDVPTITNNITKARELLKGK